MRRGEHPSDRRGFNYKQPKPRGRTPEQIAEEARARREEERREQQRKEDFQQFAIKAAELHHEIKYTQNDAEMLVAEAEELYAKTFSLRITPFQAAMRALG